MIELWWVVAGCRSGSAPTLATPTHLPAESGIATGGTADTGGPSETGGSPSDGSGHSGTSPTGCDGPCRPFPQHVATAPGTLLPSGSRVELDDAVRAAWADWKDAWLSDLGDGRFRVVMDASREPATVSEGQGYGMLLAATMAGDDPDAQRILDGLWRYAQDHPSSRDGRLMDWHVPADESAEPGDDDSAFDGDVDLALGLLMADAQWGSAGTVDYRADALRVIDGIRGSTIGPDSHLPMLGDWVRPDGATYDQRTVRPSDFVPTHFDAFERATGDPGWSDVTAAVHATLDALQAGSAPVTGLVPDFTVPTSATDPTPVPAPPRFLEGPWDGAYSYNAGRVPWRIGLHAALTGDPSSTVEALKISRWVQADTGGRARRVKPGYRLDGTPIPPGDGFTSFFAAPIGVAATLDPTAQAWLDDLWGAVKDRREGYYEDSVNLLCLLAMSGNAWTP